MTTSNGTGVNKVDVFVRFENECFACLKKEGLTKHHAIPQRLKPKKNLIIPVCRNCHDKINKDELLMDNINKLAELLKKGGEKNVEDGDSAGGRSGLKIGTKDASKGNAESIWQDIT